MSTTTTTPTTGTRRAPADSTPHVARLPEPLAGPRPARGIPFGRLVRAELRKMTDTRAGRWLLVAIGVVIAGALTVLFVQQGGDHPYGAYLQATAMPMALLLPVVGILAVTSEWSQRTALVTFTLEARRARVAWAKVVAALAVGVVAVVLSFALAAAVHAAAIGLRGATGDWGVEGTVLLGAGGYVLLGLLQGLAFGMLLRNTPPRSSSTTCCRPAGPSSGRCGPPRRARASGSTSTARCSRCSAGASPASSGRSSAPRSACGCSCPSSSGWCGSPGPR